MASSLHAPLPHGSTSVAETNAMNSILGRRASHNTPSSSMLAPPVPARAPRRVIPSTASLAAQSLAHNAQATTPSRTLYRYTLMEPDPNRTANGRSPVSDEHSGDDSYSGESTGNISHNTYESLEREVAPQVAAAASSSSYRAPSVVGSVGPRRSLNSQSRNRQSRASAFDDAAYRPASDSGSSDEGRAASVSSRRGLRASVAPQASVPPPAIGDDRNAARSSARPQGASEPRNRRTTAPKTPKAEPAQAETDIGEDIDVLDELPETATVRITAHGAHGSGTARLVHTSPAPSRLGRASMPRDPRSPAEATPPRTSRKTKATPTPSVLNTTFEAVRRRRDIQFAFVAIIVGMLFAMFFKMSTKSPSIPGYPQAQPSAGPTPASGDVSRLYSKLASLEQAVSKLESKPAATPNIESAIERSSSVQALRRELDLLRSEMASVKGVVRDHDAKFKNYAAVEREVVALKTRVTAVEQDVKAALDDGRLRSALDNLLPSRMPVRVNHKGVYSIDPSFWALLKTVFVNHDDVETRFKAVDERLNRKDKADDKNAPAPAPQEPWRLADHAAELQSWAASVFQRQAASEQLITKPEFISLVEDHLSSLREELNAVRNHVPKPGSTTIVTAKGEDLTPALQGLVDASLLKYSKDTIAQADYALYSGGARVIDEYTTQLLLVEEAGLWSRRIKGTQSIYGLPPETALTDAVQTGSCWPFKGGEGQLGVGLPRDVIVSSVTVQHLPQDLSYGDIASAPRRVEVYAKVSGEQNQRKAAYLAEKWDGQ
ncbi:SUN domain-containing protein 3 [Vanrija pseudolonga]|uniref:SUN domain-containing protein 3 n=1 Tax=Vanrija pseudolonga TaxID=143232 RepID=A0AAF1BKB5_9TREE|nr:SUN domain-containing protein 3 [Vanrija pseudolonga]